MKRSPMAVIAATALCLVFVAGIVHLFLLRFQSGDMYPLYSSLRADPLGTKALYESLGAFHSLSVRRNFDDLRKLDGAGDAVLLFLGDTVSSSPNEDLGSPSVMAALNSFVRRGGRVVVTLLPRNWDRGEKKTDNAKKQEEKARARKAGSEKNKPEKPRARKQEIDTWEELIEGRPVPLTNWLKLAFMDLPVTAPTVATLNPVLANAGLPKTVSCHTSLCFTNIDKKWRIVYKRAGCPVIVEKGLGKGTFVLSTLTYFVSNEALRNDRNPGLLTWLIGGKSRIVFDETHLGTTKSPGVAVLLRRYRLERLGLGLLALAVLFVWQKNVSLVPVRSDGEADTEAVPVETAEGRDSLAGLTNLLRRNIPSGRILSVCVAEWKKSVGRVDRRMQKKISDAEAIAGQGENMPVPRAGPDEKYNEICAIVQEKLPKQGARSAQKENEHGHGTTETDPG